MAGDKLAGGAKSATFPPPKVSQERWKQIFGGNSMLKIETRIDPIEIDGEEVKGLPKEDNQVSVKAHWNVNDLVVLEFQGKSVTVVADQLERAIQNAKNHDS